MKGKTSLLAVFGAALLLSACSGQDQGRTSNATAEPAPAPAPVKPAPNPNLPLAQQGENWEYLVNNAMRTMDHYAVSRNPDAVFLPTTCTTDFIKQIAGEYNGRYILTINCDNGGAISFARLLPLFDENASSDKLDDQGELWKILNAKHNGRKF